MKNQFLNRFKGFTLIELMIAIAIIGILSAIAVPTYNSYVYKARISELVSRSTALEAAVEEYVGTNGVTTTGAPVAGVSNFTLPAGIGSFITLLYGGCQYGAGNTVPSGNVALLCLETNGSIYVKGIQATAPTGTGSALLLTPTLNPDGTIVWTCTSCDATTANYAPANCKTIAANCPSS